MADANVFEFDDYRRYLRAWFKARDGRPSQAQFAKRVYCTRALITDILNGKKRMTRERMVHCPEKLGLTGRAEEYFLELVLKADGETFQIREEAALRAHAMQLLETANPDVHLLVGLYQDWLRTVVFELGKHPEFRAEPAWIVEHVRPEVTEEHAAEVLAWLDEVGLLGENGLGRLAVVAEKAWSSADVKDNVALMAGIVRQHLNFLEQARSGLLEVHGSQRRYGSVTSIMSESRWQEIRDLVRRTEREVLLLVHKQDDEPLDRVVHVQFQVFPLTPTGQESASG